MEDLPLDKILAKLPLTRELVAAIHGNDDNMEMDDRIEKFCETFCKVSIYFVFHFR